MVYRPEFDKRRRTSVYFPSILFEEVLKEKNRLNCTMSCVVRKAWEIAREEIKKIPSVNG